VATSTYLLPIPPSRADKLAWIAATTGAGNSQTFLIVTDATGKVTNLPAASAAAFPADSTLWFAIELPQALEPGVGTLKISIALDFVNVLTPLPAVIAQMDDQKVVYEGNVYFDSAYASTSITSTFKVSFWMMNTFYCFIQLFSDKVESFSKEIQPTKQTKQSIKAGKFEKIAAFAFEPMRIHFVHNAPFMTFTSVFYFIFLFFFFLHFQ
jgi:hypothetical protein